MPFVRDAAFYAVAVAAVLAALLNGEVTLPEACTLGEAVQVEPMKPVLKPPGSMLLKLKYDVRLSNFPLKFNLRRDTSAVSTASTSSCCCCPRALPRS